MKLRRNLLGITVSGLCLAGLQLPPSGALAAEPAAASAEKPKWIMTINGETVTTEAFNLFYGERLRQSQTPPSPQLQNQVISDLINLTLVAEDARQRGIDKQPDIQSALRLQQDQLLNQVAFRVVTSSVNPSQEDLKKAFDAHYLNRPATEYKTRHVLVSSEEEAKTIIKKLEGGAKFEALAKDTQDPTGDDLGWINPADVVVPFAEVLKAMKPGTYSTAPVKTDFGWHVILLEETRETKPRTLEDVKAELIASLKQAAVKDYLTGLREKAKIEINPALAAKAAEAVPSGAAPKPADKK